MKPSRHIIASLTIGAVLWFFTRSLYAGLLCFASGVLVDLDHIPEYIVHHGWKGLTLKKMYQACEETGRQEGELRFKKLYIVFHTGEIVLLLWALTIYTGNIYLLAITSGYSLHLILDFVRNPLRFPSFFMFYRVIKRFDSGKLLKKKL